VGIVFEAATESPKKIFLAKKFITFVPSKIRILTKAMHAAKESIFSYLHQPQSHYGHQNDSNEKCWQSSEHCKVNFICLENLIQLKHCPACPQHTMVICYMFKHKQTSSAEIS
jgi:hypothetical protein